MKLALVFRTLPTRVALGLAAVVAGMLTSTSTRAAEDGRPAGPEPTIETASWIWGPEAADVCEFRTTLILDSPPTMASIQITADNGYELYVNGALVGFDIGAGGEIWNSLAWYDIKPRLAQGRNVLGIRGICLGGYRGVVAAARIELASGKQLQLASDHMWRVTLAGDPAEYSHPEYLEDDQWSNARELGKMGMAPWGTLVYSGSQGGRRQGALPSSVSLSEPDEDFAWPQAVAFLSDDCSVYAPLRGDAWGVCFRVNNWSRNDNRTDRFTFSADSPLNPRTLQEAVRALGCLEGVDAVSLLHSILADHTDPRTGNLFLAETAIDALARIPGPEPETILVAAFGKLQDYIRYVGWYSDHPALYTCHASPLHARVIAAFDYRGTCGGGPVVDDLVRSVPTDPDRALFAQNDTYELLVGRVVRRSGRGDELIETCLALLGDPEARGAKDLEQALRTTFAALAGTPAPDNRAAQILSAVCRDAGYESRIRTAYERYRALPEDPVDRPLGNPSWIPQRHWVLFYLGRALGNLGDERSVDVLTASLGGALNEARHGRPDPAEPNIHFLQLEYTPCWRATAAWALGRIGDPKAVPHLLAVVANLDNATDTRHAAAEALERIADPTSLDAIRHLAADYPEVSTRRALLHAALRCRQPAVAASSSPSATTRMQPGPAGVL